MLLIEHGPRGAVDVSRRKPTWVIYDGKRVAKFQFVGDRGRGGYFTLVPVDKSGAQPRTEYLTHRTTKRSGVRRGQRVATFGALTRAGASVGPYVVRTSWPEATRSRT
jgi:hypothetical protein